MPSFLGFGWADAETARLLGFAAMIAVLVAFLCISAEARAARERGGGRSG